MGKQADIIRAVGWGMVYQAASVPISIVSMVVLARALAPSEYGKIAVVTGCIGVLSIFGCQGFMAHALQLPDADEPDWGLHWAIGCYIQLVLCVIANAIAGIMWCFPKYAELAPLLHVASLSLPLNVPHLLVTKMLERRFDFRMVNLLGIAQILLAAMVSLGLAWQIGAYAVIIGGSLCNLLPTVIYLFCFLKWMPPARWWKVADLRAYNNAFKFGLQASAGNLLQGLKGLGEATILPGSLGLTSIGLVNRGQALFQSTLGRLMVVAMDGIYPILPRLASNLDSFRNHAVTFMETAILGLVIMGGLIAIEGPQLSRILYGAQWRAADALLLPCTLTGMCVMLMGCARSLLLAANRLRESVLVTIAGTVAALGPIVGTAFGLGLEPYVWVAFALHLLACLITISLARSLLARSLVPILGCSLITATAGALAVAGLRRCNLVLHPAVECGLLVSVYGLVTMGVLRFAFPQFVRPVLKVMPMGAKFSKALGMG